jgi:predicted house-cleaning noncanonical NTP pyrophosphatase (MazG superfamily)
MKYTFKMKVLSATLDEDLKEWLTRKYVTDQATLTEISIKIAQMTKISVDIGTLSRWMKKMQIPLRERSYRRKHE